jgi:hypothetical protein
MSSRGAAAVLAGLVLLVGVLLGFGYHATTPGPTYENGKPVICGSAFLPDHTDAAASDLVGQATGTGTGYQAACSDALSTPKIAAFGMVGVSVLALLFCGLTIRSDARRPVPVSEDVAS